MKETILRDKGIGYLRGLEAELKKDIARIYADAARKKCDRVIWSNEGLYLLNTEKEYRQLIGLFSDYSTDIEVVCCFRDVPSYRESYKRHLAGQNLALSEDPDSYRYLEPDSWLFDYPRKKALLSQVFDACTYFSYDPKDNVSKFLEALHISGMDTGNYRLNVTHTTLLQRIKKDFAVLHRKRETT